MSLQHTIDTFEARDASPSRAGSERYWAPCLAVALVAMSLFYVTLKDLVHESAARAPAPPPAVMPEGDAIYSDGPCPEGASASTLRLPRDLHASASQ
ncbi:hypothetical protein J2W30_000612 [Variovorax boronicumulans]|uniref:hypothetical protein n=1 Tax=Variovorax boronicumulans TaxID=436515 RepID=UPI0027834C45|nr:hypothetical protein [Variovorax boronicumulans]MDQ0032871.1 hypothetical protein [Variovorax boronicumulans]